MKFHASLATGLRRDEFDEWTLLPVCSACDSPLLPLRGVWKCPRCRYSVCEDAGRSATTGRDTLVRRLRGAP
jgi:ribosomal protein L37AE/L43A